MKWQLDPSVHTSTHVHHSPYTGHTTPITLTTRTMPRDRSCDMHRRTQHSTLQRFWHRRGKLHTHCAIHGFYSIARHNTGPTCGRWCEYLAGGTPLTTGTLGVTRTRWTSGSITRGVTVTHQGKHLCWMSIAFVFKPQLPERLCEVTNWDLTWPVIMDCCDKFSGTAVYIHTVTHCNWPSEGLLAGHQSSTHLIDM